MAQVALHHLPVRVIKAVVEILMVPHIVWVVVVVVREL
jgi:hypothetical protein